MNNGPLKIVAIDDREDSVMALRAVLADALPEAQVFTAWNGRAGIELALAEDPDVILLALGLPEMDGHEVCRKLKADGRLSSIPVVLLTALRTDRRSRIKALEEGAAAFLPQPCDEAELIAQVRALARIKVAGQRQKQEAQRLAALVDRQARELEREFAERRRVEAALRQSEECYRGFFDDDLTGNVVSTPEGQILLCNPAFAKIFGFASIQEAIGTDIRVLYRDAAEHQSIIETLRQHGKVERLETWRKRRDGTLIHIIESLIGHCNRRDELCQIRSYIFDDTERTRAAEALRESDERFRVMFEAHGAVMLLVEPQTGAIVDANAAAARFYGYSRAHLRTLCVQDINQLPPEQVAAERAAAVAQQRNYFIFPHRLAGGEHRWVEVYSSPVQVRDRPLLFSIIHDITDRRRAEEALRVSEERFRRVFEEGPVGMALTRRDFGFLQINPAFCRMLGYTAEEMKNLTVLDIGHPEHRVADQENVEGLWQGKMSCYRMEKRYVTKAGDICWGSLSASLIRDQEGTPLHALAIVEDVTERKRAEEELHAHRRQLRALASELTLAEERERRRIAADLHDHACQDLVLAKMNLQTLLAGVSSAGGAVLREIDRTLGEVIASVRELTFNLSSPTLYKFGLVAALEELLEDKLGAERDMQYDFSDDGAPKPLSEDAQVLLFQSVREVLINILKHARAHNVALDIRRREGSIRISVTDDGVGFDTDEVSSLPARHHGFGLFSIRERLDCIGGALEIDSRRGAGSRFILVAPLQIESRDGGRKHEVGEDSARG